MFFVKVTPVDPKFAEANDGLKSIYVNALYIPSLAQHPENPEHSIVTDHELNQMEVEESVKTILCSLDDNIRDIVINMLPELQKINE